MDYLDWQSSISLEQVFASGNSFSYPSYFPDLGVAYIAALKSEKSRSALMLHTDTESICLTPQPYSLQTKVNEYGGKPYWLGDDSLVFANQSDQCLYQQRMQGSVLCEPFRITPKPDDQHHFMYTDVHLLENDQKLAIIELEKPDSEEHENQMFIGSIPQNRDEQPKALVHGADFYSNFVVDQDRDRVAWVQWSHPNMPWDDTELWIADLNIEGPSPVVRNARKLSVQTEGVIGASICQLIFSNNGNLFFSADYSSSQGAENFWNVHVYEPDTDVVKRVTSNLMEHGYPHWVYGDHRIVQLNGSYMLSVASAVTGDSLVLIDQNSFEANTIVSGDATIQHLYSNRKGCCLAIKLAKDTNPSMVEFELVERKIELRQNNLISGTHVEGDISLAEAISYPTRDGCTAHGFYYEPSNELYSQRTDKNRLPPLIVMVHGGPTARAYGHFDLQKQFWSSRGFALLDVNHRGSSGFGRRYRDELYGRWGERDAQDIIDAISYLIEQGKADAERVCIRGKSAGGYAVLRALTEYPETFKAGACYYGIGNLVTLAEVTHKFEKHYTDRLVDEEYNSEYANIPSSRFYQRSPINKIHQIESAMIVFQGKLDKVVPPSVAREVVNKFKLAELDHEYVEYADEGHGFRQVANNIDAWKRELQFYRRILGL